MKPLITSVTFSCVLLFSGTVASAAGYSLTNIMDSSVAAPAGNYFNIGNAAISGNRVAFKASYDQGYSGIFDSIFTSTGGPRTLITQTHNNAPASTGYYDYGGGTFNALGRPAIDGSTVYFDAEVFHFENFSYAYGIFKGPFVTTAVSQRQAPQFTRVKNTADVYVSSNFFSYRSSSANTAALDTIRVSDRARTTNIKIIGAGDDTPDGSRFSYIDLNYGFSGNTVVFRGGFGDQEGIFTGNGGPLGTIAKKGDVVPSGGTFDTLLDPAMSGSKVAFLGTYSGGSGIFTGDGGALVTIVRSGDATPTGDTFSSFSVPAIGGATIAFRGTHSGIDGIYTKTGAVLRMVVGIGDPLFGSTVTSLTFSDLGLDQAGSGNLAFTYGLANGRTGVAMATLGAGLPSIFQDAAGTIPVPDSVGIVWVPAPNFEGRDLRRAWLYGADLTNTNARNTNLTNAVLRSADLSNADLTGANLTNAAFTSARLNGATFTGANIRGTDFERTAVTTQECGLFSCAPNTTFYGGISPAQLATTANYQSGDLSDVKLTRNNLTNANFAGKKLQRTILHAATLTDANFNVADISGASFGRYSVVNGCEKWQWGSCTTYTTTFGTGLSVAQLTATASYQTLELANIDFSGNQLAAANLDGQNLTGSSFYGADLSGATLRGANMVNANFYAAQMSGANLRGADARGALFTQAVLTNAVVNNFVSSDGHISGIDLAAGETLQVRDYDGDAERNLAPIAVTVDQSFMMSGSSTLRMQFEADAWDSTISFAAGIPVTRGGNLELLFDNGINASSQIGRTLRLFNWTGVSPTGAFAISSPYVWDLSNLYITGEVMFLAAAGVPGDFNNDGSVDAGDYVVWRKGLGTIFTQAAHNVWRTHFGQTVGSGVVLPSAESLPAAVPEPSSLLLVKLAAAGLFWRRRVAT